MIVEQTEIQTRVGNVVSTSKVLPPEGAIWWKPAKAAAILAFYMPYDAPVLAGYEISRSSVPSVHKIVLAH